MKKLCKSCGEMMETNELGLDGYQETLEGYKKSHRCTCGNGLLGDTVDLCSFDCDTCFDGCDKRQAPFDPTSFDSIEGLTYNNWQRRDV